MKFVVVISAYDVISNVSATANVRQYDDYEDGPGVDVLRHTTTFPGEGVDDARTWLQDVLVALLESL